MVVCHAAGACGGWNCGLRVTHADGSFLRAHCELWIRREMDPAPQLSDVVLRSVREWNLVCIGLIDQLLIHEWEPVNAPAPNNKDVMTSAGVCADR